MEIPCLLYFSGDEKNVKKLSNLFTSSGRDKWHRKCEENADEEIHEEKDASISCEKRNKDSSSSAIKLSSGECKSVASSKLLQNEDRCETNIWVSFAKHQLTLEDKWIIESGMELTDKHINFAQSLIFH